MKVPKSIDVCGLEYKIKVISGKKMAKLFSNVSESCEGVTDVQAGIIYLNKVLLANPTRLRDTLHHEALGHALWDASGIGYWLQGKLKMKRKKWFQFQEEFIRLHTPAAITTSRSLGDLR